MEDTRPHKIHLFLVEAAIRLNRFGGISRDSSFANGSVSSGLERLNVVPPGPHFLLFGFQFLENAANTVTWTFPPQPSFQFSTVESDFLDSVDLGCPREQIITFRSFLLRGFPIVPSPNDDYTFSGKHRPPEPALPLVKETTAPVEHRRH